MTVVYASDEATPGLRLIREPSPVTGTTMLRVANYSEDAGLVDVRVGGLVVARGLDYNRVDGGAPGGVGAVLDRARDGHGPAGRRRGADGGGRPLVRRRGRLASS